MMDEATKSGYVAGVVSLIASAVLIVLAVNVGWDMTGQIMGILGLVFAILGVGSIWKPEIIGPVAAQILENMAKNAEDQTKTTNRQTQSKSRNSPQGYTEKGNVHVTQNFYDEKK